MMPQSKPEDTFWRSRPVLAHVRRLADCKGQSPWPLLGWAIVRSLHTVPFNIHYKSIIGLQSLNTLVGIAGPTGAGKTISQRLVEEHFVFPDNNPSVPFAQSWAGLTPPGSGESMPDWYVLFDALKDSDSSQDVFKDRLSKTLVWRHPNHAAVFFFDEVGMLASRSGRQGSTLIDYMKEGWSGSEFGRTLASGKGVVLPSNAYRFSCVINTQPKRAGILFSEEAVAGGLQGRFLWFDVTADVDRGSVTVEDVSKFVIPEVGWSGVEHVEATDAMNRAHVQHRWDALDGLIDETESHLLLTRAKVAVAFAVLDGRAQLNAEDWALSEVVIQHTSMTRKAIGAAVAEEYRRATVREGRKAAVKVTMSEEARHMVDVQLAAAAIYRWRQKNGKQNVPRSAMSKKQRDLRSEAEDFLSKNPDWRPSE